MLCSRQLQDTLARMGYKGDFDDTVNILFDNQLITSSSPVANEEKTNTIENNEGSLPAEYSVEYVRLYQKQGDVLVLEDPRRRSVKQISINYVRQGSAPCPD